jgi:hypothetical protein
MAETSITEKMPTVEMIVVVEVAAHNSRVRGHMRRARFVSILAFVAIISPQNGAQAGLYAEIGTGVATARSASVPQVAGVEFAIRPRDGWTIGGAVGYRFTDRPIRLGLDIGFTDHDLTGTYFERIQLAIFPPCGQPNRPCLDQATTGSLRTSSVIPTATYVFALSPLWTLDVAAGAGVTDVNLRMRTRASFLDGRSNALDLVDDGGSSFVMRAAVGVAHAVGRADVFARYTFTDADRVTTDGQGNLRFQFGFGAASHALTAGVRFGF